MMRPEERLGTAMNRAACVEAKEPTTSFGNLWEVQEYMAAQLGGKAADYFHGRPETRASAERLGIEPQWRRAVEQSAELAPAIDMSVRSAARATPRSVPPLATREEVQIIRADSIRPEPVDWLWEGYLAARKLHILAGAPGTGKTTLALALAATLTCAGRWPDGSRAEPGDVLIWSGEDSTADTLVPRLLASGADCSKVHFVGRVDDLEGTRPFEPASDFPELERAAAKLPNLRLVLIDPIVSAIAGDSHKNAEVRRGLQPVVDFAERTGCAVLGISHFSKGSAGRDVVERVTGSLAFGAMARIVLATARAGEDAPEGGRLMVRAKSNIGPDGGGFQYELCTVELAGPHKGIVAPRVEWGQPVEGAAREILADVETVTDPDKRSDLDDAKAFLADLLAHGPVLAKRGRADAEGAGHSWATIRRAIKALGVRSEKEGMTGPWRWTLPPKMLKPDRLEHLRRSPSKPEDAHSKVVSNFREDEHLRCDGRTEDLDGSELL